MKVQFTMWKEEQEVYFPDFIDDSNFKKGVIFDRLSVDSIIRKANFKGVKKDVIEEGTHFLIPWLQKAIIYDVRTKPRNISTTTGSKDLQMVSLTLRVLHRPNVVELPRIYQVSLKMGLCWWFSESWVGLWWEGFAVDWKWSVEIDCCSIRCCRVDHAARNCPSRTSCGLIV